MTPQAFHFPCGTGSGSTGTGGGAPDTADLAREIERGFAKLLAAAPDGPCGGEAGASSPSPVVAAGISPGTGVPARYRGPWPRPQDAVWRDQFARGMRRITEGGMLAVIGPRGTGKTRMAAEIVRSRHPDRAHYTTAMGFFLRLRASYRKDAAESESLILAELGRAPLLVLDEIQERSESAWEDRMLTHLLDKRYGDMRPTIVIANLTARSLPGCLGESVTSRLVETGGVLEMDGPSHRRSKK